LGSSVQRFGESFVHELTFFGIFCFGSCGRSYP
jgi:hypothetical protein